MDLSQHCVRLGDDVVALGRDELDLSDRSAVRQAISTSSADVVVNCAAWTAVDDCESNPDRADLINGTAVGWLAEAATSIGAHFVQISTDYVFDGTKSGPYLEHDTTNPQSAYGRSKLLGEQAAHAATEGAASVVRTSWVYSAHGRNMVATLCRLMDSHDTLSFVDDQIGHPTATPDLAAALRSLALERYRGIVHCTNRGVVSWFEFARAVFAAAGQDPERVHPIATADLKPARPAPRPANSVLSNELFDTDHGALADFRDGLEAIVASYRP